MSQVLHFSDAPRNMAICLKEDCPMAGECLRRRVAKLAPKGMTSHNVVLPAAWSAGRRCSMFVSVEPQPVAYGMKGLFGGMPAWEAKKVREAVMPIFGRKSHFYRYREGRYPISPEMQAKVAEVFRRNGYDAAPKYDRMEQQIYFPAN